MDDFILARVLHVIGVVLWIGGVAMVTLVLLPALRSRTSPTEAMVFFNGFRRRFAAQARYTTLLVGLSGLYMTYLLDAWHRFIQWQYWWMHTMLLIWLLFTYMLFINEPRSRKRSQSASLQDISAQTFDSIQRKHMVLLVLSLITIAGAVAGSHGWLISGDSL
ncbi:Uncharacterized membrane protein [Nitrosomonas marina]|uniref:Uncharacterized membrane protein n=1 Tax=Nitrosomonas marina TaxID=917 RepID=A0A1H9YBV6_9PROT|nr:hypothetical protein [Nitrosomonas marina]SES66343.1 Uncharacterized membrane protein [Nitrosomonas marina]